MSTLRADTNRTDSVCVYECLEVDYVESIIIMKANVIRVNEYMGKKSITILIRGATGIIIITGKSETECQVYRELLCGVCGELYHVTPHPIIGILYFVNILLISPIIVYVYVFTARLIFKSSIRVRYNEPKIDMEAKNIILFVRYSLFIILGGEIWGVGMTHIRHVHVINVEYSS